MKVYVMVGLGYFCVDCSTSGVTYEQSLDNSALESMSKHSAIHEVICDYSPAIETIDDVRNHIGWFLSISEAYQCILDLQRHANFSHRGDITSFNILETGVMFAKESRLLDVLPFRLPNEIVVAQSLGRSRVIKPVVNFKHLPKYVSEHDIVRLVDGKIKNHNGFWIPFNYARGFFLNGFLDDFDVDCCLHVGDKVTYRINSELQYLWNNCEDSTRRAYMALLDKMMPKEFIQYLRLYLADANGAAIHTLYKRGSA